MSVRKHVFALLWIAACMIYIVAGAPITPFHGDESTQILMSRDYAYQFLQGDWEQVAYHNPPLNATEQELRLLNGTLSKYLIGLSWHLAGFRVEDLNDQYDWGADWNYNLSTGRIPAADLLRAARWPSAMLLALGAPLMFALGRVIGERWSVGYVSSALYALQPALLLNGRRAMMEGGMITLTLLVVLLGVWLLHAWLRPQRGQRIASVIGLGVAAGLALASKHTAAFTLASVFGACGLYALWSGIRGVPRRFTPLIALVVAAVIAAVVFVLVNPAWWGDPLGRVGEVLRLRQNLLAGQTAAFGGYASPLDALAGTLRQTLIWHPMYFEVAGWENHIGDQIARYEASALAGLIISEGLMLPQAILYSALILIGVWTLFGVDAGRSVERPYESMIIEPRNPARWIIAVWSLAMLTLVLCLTPLEWQRYYLPILPLFCLYAALGAVWLGTRIFSALKR